MTQVVTAVAAIAVVALVHWYLWRRIVGDTVRSRTVRFVSALVVSGLGVVTLALVVSGPYESFTPLLDGAADVGGVWIGVLGVVLPILLVAELVGLVPALARGGGTPRRDSATAGDGRPVDRRRTFRGIVAAVAALAAVSSGVAGAVRSRSQGPDQLSEHGRDGVEVILPFHGRWVVRNSPARRVPSHGTDEFGARYAIDFVMVDDSRRTAPGYPARAVFRPEAAESFYAYGRRVHAPVAGTVVAAHDGERDREAGRSQLALIPFALTQPARVAAGQVGLAGNHVVISVGPGGPFVVVAHLRDGSVRVRAGDVVDVGDPIGECGSSGNSTQPHVHLQAMDRPDGASARGVPMLFRSFVEHPRDGGGAVLRRNAVPDEDSVVEVPAV